MSRFQIHFRCPETIFAILALVLGTALCFLIPIGAGFDEITHLARTWEISGGALIPNQKFSQSPYLPNAFNEVSYRNRFFYTPVAPDYFQKFSQTRIDWNNFLEHKTRSVYFPIFYLPQAVVVGLLTRALDAPVLWVYYLSRLLEMLGYVLMVYLAIRWIPFGKWILGFLALAPMAMFQAGTISTDPYTNGISLLFIAWVLKLNQQEKINWKQIGILLVITLLLFSAKINTVFLVLLLVLLPVRKFPSKAAFFATWAATAMLFAGVVIGWNLLVYSAFYMNVLGYGLFAQLSYILTHPLQYLQVFFNDLAVHGGTYIAEWIGVYAYNVGRVPPAVYVLFWLGLALVWLLDAATVPVTRKTRVVLVLSALVGIVFTITVMYLVNNRVGSPLIEGVQGRYFTLVAPLLFLGLVLPRPVLPWRIYPAVPFAVGSAAVLLVYMAGLYLSFYVLCGTSYYTPGLCYQPPYKNWAPNLQFSEPLTEQSTLAQTFTAACGPLQSVRLWSNRGEQAPGEQSTRIALRDEATGAVVFEREVRSQDAPQRDWLELTFPPVAGSEGRKYVIEASSRSAEAAGALTFGVTERREYFDGTFAVNAQPVDYDLIFQYGCKVR